MVSTLHHNNARHRIRSDCPDPDGIDAALAVAEPSVFAQLYMQYVDLVYRYCFRRVGSREEAEDATSLVFTKAFAAMPLYQPNDSTFRAWLFTIAHNVIADEWRRRRPTMTVGDDLDFIDPAPTPESVVMENEDSRAVQALLSKLPRAQAEIVELRLAGLSGPEIARVLARSPNTVKVTQHRAYTRLRSLLLEKEADDAIR